MPCCRKILLTATVASWPFFALAQPRTFKDIFNKLIGIGGAAIPAMMILATVLFLWGVITYLVNADNEDKRTEGRTFMIYGIIGLFVMVAVWGLVDVLYNTFFG